MRIRFDASSTGFIEPASSIFRGTVWKDSLIYSAKTKEIIMPGIMSEGSAGVVGPMCAAP
jgi:hypothetical protein